MTRVLAGIIKAHIGDGNFVPVGSCVDRKSSGKTSDDGIAVIKRHWKLTAWIVVVPSDLRQSVRFTAERDL